MADAPNVGFTIEDSKFDTSQTSFLRNQRPPDAGGAGDVLSVYGGAMVDGTVIETYCWDGNPARQWKVEMDDEAEVPRGHCLIPQGVSPVKRVVTLKPFHQNGKLFLEEYKGKLEQLWFLIPIASTGKFSIISAYNGKAISNQGRSVNCRCVEVDPDDVNQQWEYGKL